MLRVVHYLVVAIVLLGTCACETAKDEYVTGQGYEGIIFNDNTLLANPIIITPEEIDCFESTLRRTLPLVSDQILSDLEVCPSCKEYQERQSEKHMFVFDHLSEYKRQYYGYLEEGKREIQVYGLLNANMKDTLAWKRPFEVIHRNGGERYWWLIYNISQDSITYFSINQDGEERADSLIY